MDIEIGDKVREFIKQPIVKGFGPTMMAEKLEMQKGICLSKETARRMMIAEDIWEAKSKKKEKPHLSRPRRKNRSKKESGIPAFPDPERAQRSSAGY